MVPKARSVKVDVDAFCGWGFLLELIEAAPSAFMRGLMAALFGTGGRISEVLGLETWMVDTSLCDRVVVVQQMPLLKRYEKVGDVTKWKCVGHCTKRWKEKPTPGEFATHKIQEYAGWVTKPVEDHRSFPIRVDEPVTPYFTDWWERRVEAGERVLFPIKRSAAFVRVRKVGEALDRDIPFCKIRSPLIYDHWFRSEKACQLAFDYGFDDDDLDLFFGWKERRPGMSERTSRRYSKLGWIGLARKMGVDVDIDEVLKAQRVR